jgi:hypothetical protein
MRLANRSASQGELIALALFYATCLKNLSSFWPSPSQGFFVPVDDIRDLLGPIDLEDEEAEGDAASAARADLLYVSLSRRGSLDFASIEIKYRRLLKSAKDPTLRERILVQTTNTLGTLQGKYFASTLSPTQAAIRRKTLARALQFYADKARRHGLDADTHLRLTAGIEKLVRSDGDISFAGSDCRGFIF